MKNERALEIIDETVRLLEAQGKRATTKQGNCMYRADDGCKCAAGHWIPDHAYSPDMEGGAAPVLEHQRMRVRERMIIEALFAGGIRTYEDRQVLRQLQRIHDLGSVPGELIPFSQMLDKMRALRAQYGG